MQLRGGIARNDAIANVTFGSKTDAKNRKEKKTNMWSLRHPAASEYPKHFVAH
jgi:hypothetical protein